MANKNNKKTGAVSTSKKTSAVQKNGRGARGESKLSSAFKKIPHATIVIPVAVILLVSMVIGAFAVVSYYNSRPVDYINGNLSKYISISRDDYSSFDVTVTVDRVSDTAVEMEVLKALCSNKDKTPLYDGKLVKNQTVTAGDQVNIYYRGYTLDENGSKVDFGGGNNFSSVSSSKLEIGGGSFVLGFELGLVGKNPSDYATLSKRTEGVVGEGALVQLTFSAAYPDGSTRVGASSFVDLGSANCDATYGEGFAAMLASATVNEQIKDSFIGKGAAGMQGDTWFMDMEVTAVYEYSEGTPLTVLAHFPYNYGSEELRGVDAYFDVFIETSQVYQAPELTDAFVSDTLKLKDTVSSYEGATLVDKYYSYLRAGLEKEYEDAVTAQIEEAMLAHFLDKAVVKKLPTDEVNEFYRQYVYEMETEYQTYGGNYSSLDEYANTVLNLEIYEDWKDVYYKKAQDLITEKLTFYYIAQQEGFLLDDAELSARVEKLIAEYLEQYLEQIDCKPEDFDSMEKYNQTVAAYRQEILDYYAESYFIENAYYEHAANLIRKFAKVTYAN